MSRLSTSALGAAAVAIALAMGPSSASAYTTTDMRGRVAAEAKRAGTTSGIVVRDLDTGTELYASRPTTDRIPASVEKLYTTAAFLQRMGSAATLDTEALATGPLDDAGVLRGDLVLKGAGDPFFGAESASRLIASLKRAGLRRISGGVVGDESLFDKRRSAKSTRYDFEVGGVLSGLAFDRGVAGGRAQTDAGAFAASRFAAQLSRAGIRQGRRSGKGVAPKSAIELASVPSRPARELARFVNVPSNNFAAEMLAKTLGARYGGRGSTAMGMRVMRESLEEFGISPTLVDGSGLSRANATTPREVVTLLQGMHDSPLAVSFRTSLALSGRTGTVKGRMRGTAAEGRCRVKTGTLRRVSALAGYCLSRNKRSFAFAVLNQGLSVGRAHGIQNAVAEALARIDEGGARPRQ